MRGRATAPLGSVQRHHRRPYAALVCGQGVRRAFALLLAPLLVAGCFGGGDEAQPPVEIETASNGTTAENATLPDGRGVSSGNLETNRTEAGAGGMEHKHDYWQGAEQVTLYDERVGLSFLPFFPDGEGSSPKGVAYVKLRNGTLVYEGTARVTVTISAPRVFTQDDPAPPAITLQYRTAADADWRESVPLTLGEPFEVEVQPKETDMPHSTWSLWLWRLTGDRYLENVHVNIVAHKGREVVDWPGHPDFYADRPHRIVLDADVTTVIKGFPENTMYEGNDWELPEKLISHGTERVEVWTNITAVRATSPTAAEPLAFYLNYHNATDLGFEGIFNYVEDAEGRNDKTSYHFVVPVDPAGMDAPYQPSSRWGFRLEAGYGAGPLAGVPIPFAGGGGCTDCASYEIDYHITVVAYAAPEV